MFVLGIRSESCPLIRWCGAGSFGKIQSVCGQHEIQYAEWKM